MEQVFRGTTICAVKRNGITAIGGDGQVTFGDKVIFKGNAVKVKRIFDDKVVVGFAGSVSDAFALSEKFEEMLQKFSGNLVRAAVELAETWRMDKARKLEAMLITADKDNLLIVSGTGEVIEPVAKRIQVINNRRKSTVPGTYLLCGEGYKIFNGCVKTASRQIVKINRAVIFIN